MSLIRIVHNKENPYVQLNKKALWNTRLSLKAIGLWARCMSRPDDWVFNVSEMASSGKEGVCAIRSAIDELISENYALRIERRNPVTNVFEPNDYVFFEFAISEEEKAQYLEELKKCLPQCGFPHAGLPNAENQPLLKKERKELNKEELIEGPKSLLPSPDVEAAFDLFLSKLKERSKTFKDPNRNKWLKSFDLLLRVDKRPIEEVKRLIEWASTHKWWGVACLSPDKLRKSYDEMLIQMRAETKENPKDNPQVKENINFVELVRDYLKSEKWRIQIDKEGFARIALKEGRMEDLPLNMNPQEFKKIALDKLNLKEN